MPSGMFFFALSVPETIFAAKKQLVGGANALLNV